MGLAVGSLALAISGVATIPHRSRQNPPGQQARAATLAPSPTRRWQRSPRVCPSVPGRIPKKTNKIWVAGTADRDEHVSTIARIDANSRRLRQLPSCPLSRGTRATPYEGAYGITVDDEEGTVGDQHPR